MNPNNSQYRLGRLRRISGTIAIVALSLAAFYGLLLANGALLAESAEDTQALANSGIVAVVSLAIGLSGAIPRFVLRNRK